MAIYHLSTKSISRSSGRTATASAAYRAGIEIIDERTGRAHDYSKRKGVLATEIFTPNNIVISRSKLWNMAESAENRKNSRTAREIIVNLPHELNKTARMNTVRDFAIHLSDKYGIAVDMAVHEPDQHGDKRNHHAHLLLTTRKIERLENGCIILTDKSQLEISNTQLQELGLPKAQEELKDIRKIWADITNKNLKSNRINTSIDHRSHADRGLKELPTRKLGWEASALERKGIKTEVGNYNRTVQEFNSTLNQLKIIDVQLSVQPKIVIKHIKTKHPPTIKGQTVNQAIKAIEHYDNLVNDREKQIKKTMLENCETQIKKLEENHRKLKIDTKATWMIDFRSLREIGKAAKEIKKRRQDLIIIENTDYKTDAQSYVRSYSLQAEKDFQKGKATLEACKLFKYASEEAEEQYEGVITKINRLGILQESRKIGKVYHQLGSFKTLPSVGDAVIVSYDSNGIATHSELLTPQETETSSME